MRGKTLNKPLYIGNIYLPPKANLEFYNQFIEEFTPIFVNLEKKMSYLQMILICYVKN